MGQLNYTTEKTNELLEKVNDMPETVTDGKTPVLETGTTTTLDPGQNATSEVVANGTDDAGNPKYKLNFGIPKGYDGAGGSGGGGMADSVQWANVLNKPSWVNSSTKPAYTASEVGALPSDTQIPSKTSQLTNDSGFTTSASFKTINGQNIVGSGDIVIENGGGGGDTPSSGGNVNVTNGSAVFLLLMAPGDTLRVVNCHLESMHLTPDDRAKYHRMVRAPETSDVDGSSRLLVSKISRAAVERARQADLVARYVERHREAGLLVCGDFNDTPISYTRRRIARGLTDAFRASGRGIGRSFNRDAIYVRIDHILCSKDWKPYGCHVDRSAAASDHYPVVAYLKRR